MPVVRGCPPGKPPRDPQTIPDVMRQAFAVAATGRPGPVIIDFLKNVTFPTVEIDYEFVPWTENRKCGSLRSLSTSHDLKAPEPNLGDINTLVDLIAQAEKGAGVAVGGVGGSLLVGRQHVVDFVLIVVQLVIEI